MATMNMKWIVRPDGAHEELRSLGFWYLLGGLVVTTIGVVAAYFGKDPTAAFIGGGGFIAMGLFGLLC